MRTLYTLLFSAVLMLLTVISTTNAQAQSAPGHGKNFGVGVMLGEPSGVTVKNWFSERSAFDIGAAWSLTGRNEAIHMHADYLMHSWFPENDGVAFYYGIGGRVIFADNPTAGARIPLGLTYVFTNVPLDIFVEAVPILDLAPDVKFAGNGAVGLRYYF
ncbi:hypothetical protein [Gracilimonas mengyeensis]|uniref:Outer membrane insertion C-terminal signal n=1 Tax=Gracilimonas mengyeensis TaxID=1302730 RepID=A0A521B8I0_9BACT|nr:hypothetical protein [Gracilimonas mengyeensis]SMO43379.1 hypothetical protein SAMN06265219_10294 [Gracilimonas mengyeensis]